MIVTAVPPAVGPEVGEMLPKVGAGGAMVIVKSFDPV